MKDKTTAALLALFLGWLGVHRWYLKQPGLGILYFFLMFFFMISFVLGLIDAIVLLAMDDKEFDRRYNDRYNTYEYDRYNRRSQRRDYRRPYRADRKPQEVPRARRARKSSAQSNHVPNRSRVNPFKQSGIKKYKDFDLEEAIEDFKKGLEISPKDISLHFNIACAYSLTEQVENAYAHLDTAVQLGFKDFDKIKTHDDLAYVRIQPQFEAFEQNGFRLVKQAQIEAPKENILEGDVLLTQLKRLADLRDKGLITEIEFQAEKQKLMR